MRVPTLSLPSMNSTERVSRTTSQCASTKSPIFTAADELNVHLDGGVEACRRLSERPVMPMA